MYTYLIINVISALFPVLISFDKRNYFYRRWKYLFPAMIISAIPFIIWDIIFTKIGVWGFNSSYITGLYLFNLPIEEVMFFFFIPFACLFSYDTAIYLVKRDILGKYAGVITLLLIVVFLLTGIIFIEKLYTSVVFISSALILAIHYFIIKPNYLGRFYFAYTLLLIPFLLVNGYLTGLFTSEPVVWYNNSQNLSVRIFTIPIEDVVYGFLLTLLNVTFFELFKSRNLKKITQHRI